MKMSEDTVISITETSWSVKAKLNTVFHHQSRLCNCDWRRL